MSRSLGPRLRIADDGRSCEILVLLDVVLSIYLGESFNESASSFDTGQDNNFVKIDYGNGCKLQIDHSDDEKADYYRFRWEKLYSLHYLKDTFNLSSGSWYGGATVPNIKWPINGHSDAYSMSPHLVYSIFKVPMTGQERYWLSSNRLALHVPSFIPLWTELDNGYLKFQAQLSDSPYSNFKYEHSQFLEYEIAVGKSIKTNRGQEKNLTLRDFHQHTFLRYLKAPTGIPDETMIARPIWSTWARYKKNVTQQQVEDFLTRIVTNHLPISNLELDDNWAPQYGDFEIDTHKFPNFPNLTKAIKAADGRLTLWVHPFVNAESENGRDESLRRYFVQKPAHHHIGTDRAAFGEWWDGERAYSVDFTSSDAADWYNSQLRKMQKKYSIFAFKFDAGELNTLPHHFKLRDGTEPNAYPRAYARNAATFGNAVETRVGSGTQDLPIFYRTMDRNSNWTDMGLATLIPSVLHCSLNGYFWMLPDMIGGNGYDDKLPPKELFIRWTQANTFLMAMQFSYAPFDYDKETMSIIYDMLYLRQKFLPYILEEAKKAVANKEPIIRPMWWVSDDPRALHIDDQFLIGNDFLVVPVLVEGATNRSVFIPDGSWWNDYTDIAITGPTFINIEAPLNMLPYFVRSNTTSPALRSVKLGLWTSAAERFRPIALLAAAVALIATALSFWRFR